MLHMRGLPVISKPSQTDVAVIIPSTGRAKQCARLVERIHDTSHHWPVVVVSVEHDDAETYMAELGTLLPPSVTPWCIGLFGPAERSSGHVAAINRAVRHLLEQPESPRMIIKMDDDHWPVSSRWDVAYLAALDALGGTGVVYGNDLFQGEKLPTVPGLSTNIVRELGWYAPPRLGHLFCDNFWLELGRRSGRLTYMPEVIIEHRHPHAGKAAKDGVYEAGGLSDSRWLEDQHEWAKMLELRDGVGRGLLDQRVSQMDEWAGRVRQLAGLDDDS